MKSRKEQRGRCISTSRLERLLRCAVSRWREREVTCCWPFSKRKVRSHVENAELPTKICSFLVFLNLLKKLFRHLDYQSSWLQSIWAFACSDLAAVMLLCAGAKIKSNLGIIMLAGLVTCGHPSFAFPVHTLTFGPRLFSYVRLWHLY